MRTIRYDAQAPPAGGVQLLTRENMDKAFDDPNEIKLQTDNTTITPPVAPLPQTNPPIVPVTEPKPGYVPPAAPQAPPLPPVVGASTIPEGAQYEEFRYLQRKYPDIEIPQEVLNGITPENHYEKFEEFYASNMDIDSLVDQRITESFDPRLRTMQQMIASGSKFEEVLDSYAKTGAMYGDNEKVIVANLKDQYGFSEDQAKNHIEKLKANPDFMNLEADKARAYFTQKGKQWTSEQTALQQQAAQRKESERTESFKQQIDTFNKLDTVLGIPVSEAQKREFPELFRQMITPDKEGVMPIVRQLRSNDALMKVAYALAYGDTDFRLALTNKAEEVKRGIENKLFPNPPASGTSSHVPTSKEELLDRLAS